MGRRHALDRYHAHGAVFAEVKVDPDLGQMRVTRVVGAFAAGRIINPRPVKSQYYGEMIWGVSFALHEQAIMDPRSGPRPISSSGLCLQCQPEASKIGSVPGIKPDD